MAMTKEELQERINRATQLLLKAQKKADKYGKLLTADEKELVDKYYKYNATNNKILRDALAVDGWSYNSDVQMYRQALDEIDNRTETIKKYETKIQEIENFENDNKIEVLVKFLDNWGKIAYDFYIENANLYCDLKAKEKEECEKYMQKYSSSSKPSYVLYNIFLKEYYADIAPVTQIITTRPYSREIDTAKLEKIIEDEKVKKYKDLIERVTKEVGEIVDASDLSIGSKNGELNGIIVGKNGKVRIETISAGGYNIQCLHYRVLVKRLK